MSSTTGVFKYDEIAPIYESMNRITGDTSDPTSIAGLLNKIDMEYHDVVNGSAGEDALAIYGDLGRQLLLNWENTAATFPSFVNNFSTWSTVVAQSANDYAQFEEAVKGIRADNPLGWNSGGIQDSYVATSIYANSFTDEELDALANAATIYDLVGAYYVDTGMVSYVDTNTGWNIFGDLLSVASIIASGCSLVKGIGAIASGSKAVGGVGSAAANVLDDGVVAGANLLDDGANLAVNAANATNKSVFSVAKVCVANMTDDALAKALGLTDDMVNAIKLDGGTVRQYALELIKSNSGLAGKVVSAFSSVGSSTANVLGAAKAGIVGMTDDAIIKILGLSDDAVAAIKVDGGTVRQYALEAIKANSGLAGKFASAVSNVGVSTSRVFNAAKLGISNMTDDALAKVLGLTDDMVNAIKVDGGTVRQYAFEIIKTDLALAGEFAGNAIGKVGIYNIVGTGTSIGSNVVMDSNMNSAYEMVANTQSSVLDSGALRTPTVDIVPDVVPDIVDENIES